MSDLSWKNSWNLFAKEIEDCYSKRLSEETINTHYGGAVICWKGVIESLDFSEFSSMVDVSVDKVSLLINNCDPIVIDGLSLSVSRDNLSAWEVCSVGDCIRFNAMLGGDNGVFPALRLKRLTSGKCILLITLSQAMPVNK